MQARKSFLRLKIAAFRRIYSGTLFAGPFYSGTDSTVRIPKEKLYVTHVQGGRSAGRRGRSVAGVGGREWGVGTGGSVRRVRRVRNDVDDTRRAGNRGIQERRRTSPQGPQARRGECHEERR